VYFKEENMAKIKLGTLPMAYWGYGRYFSWYIKLSWTAQIYLRGF